MSKSKIEKCKWNSKDDCNDCSYEGCPSYGASLTEEDLEMMKEGSV